MATEGHNSTAPIMNKLHREIVGNEKDAQRLVKTAKEKAAELGEMLLAKKEELKHGEFIPWIEANCEFSRMQANRYIRVHEAKCNSRVTFDACTSIREVLDLGKQEKAEQLTDHEKELIESLREDWEETERIKREGGETAKAIWKATKDTVKGLEENTEKFRANPIVQAVAASHTANEFSKEGEPADTMKDIFDDPIAQAMLWYIETPEANGGGLESFEKSPVEMNPMSFFRYLVGARGFTEADAEERINDINRISDLMSVHPGRVMFLNHLRWGLETGQVPLKPHDQPS